VSSPSRFVADETLPISVSDFGFLITMASLDFLLVAGDLEAIVLVREEVAALTLERKEDSKVVSVVEDSL